MKILFIVSDANCRGGTEILAFNLLHELNKRGVESWLLSRYIYKGENPKVISFTEDEFKVWSFLNNFPINKLLGSLFSDLYFRKIITKYANTLKVDWIINHTYDLIGAIPTNRSYKTAQIFNWSINGYEETLRASIHNKALFKRIISSVSLEFSKIKWHRVLPEFSKLVVLTDSAHKEIKNTNLKVRDEDIVTIPDPLMKSNESKHLSSLNNKNIIFVGRLSHEKGVIRLLRIWKSVNIRLPDYTLRIYGEGHAKNEMKEYIKLNNIKNVEFMGFCSNIELIYLNADLCCLTSDTEGFGMVLIESMYYGVPCISFDCPISPKEIIADAGIIVPAFDEYEYVNKIVSYLNDNNLKQKLQYNSIKRAKSFYIKDVVERWINLIKENKDET